MLFDTISARIDRSKHSITNRGWWNADRDAFPALIIWSHEGKYWLFVLGFIVGAYFGAIPKYAAAVSFVIGLFEQALQSYFIFLQVGIIAGIIARGT